MTDASFASLSPRLLARKGGAKPAMRSQLPALDAAAQGFAAANLDDLGWNDMGDDSGPVALANPAIRSAEVISIGSSRMKGRLDAADQALAANAAGQREDRNPFNRAVAARNKGDRLAFTLRLDPGRHLKLRLACTLRHCSAQQLVTDALDALLADMPDIHNLATQIGRE